MTSKKPKNSSFKYTQQTDLPKLKAIGGVYYDSLHSHKSYTILLFQFLFSKELSVFSRMARANRGKTKLNDMTMYDVETSKELLAKEV